MGLDGLQEEINELEGTVDRLISRAKQLQQALETIRDSEELPCACEHCSDIAASDQSRLARIILGEV